MLDAGKTPTIPTAAPPVHPSGHLYHSQPPPLTNLEPLAPHPTRTSPCPFDPLRLRRILSDIDGTVSDMATKNVTTTLDEDQLALIRSLVGSGKDQSISGFVQHAVRGSAGAIPRRRRSLIPTWMLRWFLLTGWACSPTWCPRCCPVSGFADRLWLNPARAVCLLLVDGLGWQALRAHPEDAPFLTSLTGNSEPIIAGFPATTATSVAAVGGV